MAENTKVVTINMTIFTIRNLAHGKRFASFACGRVGGMVHMEISGAGSVLLDRPRGLTANLRRSDIRRRENEARNQGTSDQPQPYNNKKIFHQIKVLIAPARKTARGVFLQPTFLV